jgi:hypothetical protein
LLIILKVQLWQLIYILVKVRVLYSSHVLFSEEALSRVLVGHAYNPSYSGGRDQEARGSKPARANKLQDPISKLFTHTKKAKLGLVEWLKVKALSSTTSTSPAKKKKKSIDYIPLTSHGHHYLPVCLGAVSLSQTQSRESLS